jgi:hypothetical protein
MVGWLMLMHLYQLMGSSVPDVFWRQQIQKALNLSGIALPLIMFLIGFGLCDSDRNRFGFHRVFYYLPATTRQLVGLQLLNVIAAVTLFYGCFAGIFRWMLGVTPPLLEPWLYLIAIQTGFLAIAWSLPDCRLARMALVFGMFWGLFQWTFVRWNIGLGYNAPVGFPSTQIWVPLIWSRAAGLLIVIAVAWVVAAAGVARERQGSAWGTRVFQEGLSWFGELTKSRPQRRANFNSPAAAQFWMEWHFFGWLMPAGMLLLQMGVGSYYVFYWDAHDFLETLIKIAVSYPVWGGFILGVVICILFSGASIGMNPFRATRPLGDQAVAYAILKVGAAGLLLSWGLGFLGLVMAAGLLAIAGHASTVTQLITQFGFSAAQWPLGVLRPVMALASGWVICGLLISLGLRGWSKGVAVILFLPLLFPIGFIVAHGLLPKSIGQPLFALGRVFFGLGMPLMILAGFVVAGRRGLIGRRLVIASVALCGILIGCAVLRWISAPGSTLNLERFQTFIYGLIYLPLTPLALGPIAVYRNRHR